MDERIYLWLKQCSTSESVMDTDISLVNFATLITDVQLNRFNFILPDSVVELSNKEKKKKKTEAEIERNSNMIAECKLKPNEAWNKFVNKTNDGPLLSLGCKPCLKFHVKGFCYSDCSHRASHKGLNEEDTKKVVKFVKELRNV